jgi:hypothetical protein
MSGQVSARDCYYHQSCDILPWAVLCEADNPTQGPRKPLALFLCRCAARRGRVPHRRGCDDCGAERRRGAPAIVIVLNMLTGVL